MNFNKDNEQKLVKRQNKKCYDKIRLMFLSFPTRHQSITSTLHTTSLSSVSVFRLTCCGYVLGQCTHHKLSIFLVFRLNWFITLSFTITIRVDSKSFYRFKINAAGSLLIVSRVSDTGHGFCPSWSCPARFRSPGSEPRLMRHGARAVRAVLWSPAVTGLC